MNAEFTRRRQRNTDVNPRFLNMDVFRRGAEAFFSRRTNAASRARQRMMHIAETAAIPS